MHTTGIHVRLIGYLLIALGAVVLLPLLAHFVWTGIQPAPPNVTPRQSPVLSEPLPPVAQSKETSCGDQLTGQPQSLGDWTVSSAVPSPLPAVIVTPAATASDDQQYVHRFIVGWPLVQDGGCLDVYLWFDRDLAVGQPVLAQLMVLPRQRTSTPTEYAPPQGFTLHPNIVAPNFDISSVMAEPVGLSNVFSQNNGSLPVLWSWLLTPKASGRQDIQATITVATAESDAVLLRTDIDPINVAAPPVSALAIASTIGGLVSVIVGIVLNCSSAALNFLKWIRDSSGSSAEQGLPVD